MVGTAMARIVVTQMVVGVLVLFSAVFARAEVVSVDFAPDSVFVPTGFDDNDNSQIVLDGEFPSTCFRVMDTKVKVDKTKKVIEVTDKALYYKGQTCMDMQVSYFKSIQLGILASGSYSVKVKEAGGVFKHMAILNVGKAAIASPDNFVYAPVDEAHLDLTGVVPRVVVSGIFRKSCLKFQGIRVKVTGQVVEVLPIVEEDGSICGDAIQSFEESKEVPGLPSGRVLLHVRSLNGQAFNRMLSL